MSDRSPTTHAEGTKPGASSDATTDLSALKATKEMCNESPEPDARIEVNSAALDLASASIPCSKDVHRLSAPHDQRTRPLHAPSLEARVSTSRAGATKTREAPKPNGVFNNPHYPYRGGIIGRLITFFANLLKVLERLLLAALGAGKDPLPAPRISQQAKPAAKEPAGKLSLTKKGEKAKAGKTPRFG